MSVTYQIDARSRTLRTRCFGNLTLQEVADHFRELAQDPACPERLDVFLDVSAVESLPEASQIPAVVEQLKRIQGRVRFGACAIVAGRDALFGMMRMFEAMGEEYFRTTRTFRSVSEAEAWLASLQAQGGTPPAAGS